MKVAILLEDLYQVLEVWYPYFRLREADIGTVLVGTGKKHYKSKEGYPAEEELTIRDAVAKDFSGVIIPGGYAPDILRRHKEVNNFVKSIYNEGRMVASICHGAWVLISADILKGKEVTCFDAIKDDVINAGARYRDEEVVVDENLITSRNPYDLPAFCAEIIRFLEGGQNE
jgi:protease I